MREKLARLITNVLNPFLVSFIVIVLLAFKGTASAAAVKWASISLALSVLPMLVVVIYLVRRKKLDAVFENPRRQRTSIYLLAVALGALGYWLLWYLQAPDELVATFAAGLAAICVFTVINLFWKISVHTAFLAGAITIFILVYGILAAWAVLLLPPVVWARIELKQHNLLQAVVGTIIVAIIVAGFFWAYHLIGGIQGAIE